MCKLIISLRGFLFPLSILSHSLLTMTKHTFELEDVAVVHGAVHTQLFDKRFARQFIRVNHGLEAFDSKLLLGSLVAHQVHHPKKPG